MKIQITTVALAVATLVPVLATAESLKEKEERKREDEILQNSAKEMNDTCKTNIKVVGDWDTFKGELTNTNHNHVGLNCADQVLDQLKGLCMRSDEGKAAVKAGVTTFRCQGGGDADISLSNKTLVFKTKLDSQKSGVRDDVRKWLEGKL
jgi:hypothetical protein